MMNLPSDFEKRTSALLGETDYQLFSEALRHDIPVSIRVNVEKSINHFKDSFCIANRKTQNEKTLHADLLLAGITQLVTVLVADNIHQHQYIRSLKPLIA